ncbi:MAG: hypothetical protein V4864_10055 [Pseudomonadota bacterium]
MVDVRPAVAADAPRLLQPGNEAARRFYRRLGGSPVTDWERWSSGIRSP